MANQFERFVGRTVVVQGLNEPRIVKLVRVYNVNRHAIFEGRVQGNYQYFKDNDRENFTATSLVKGGKLVKSIRVLTA